MMTGDQVLIHAMRPECVQGAFVSWAVSRLSPDLSGGAWLDAPDMLAAGSTRRVEEWNGNEGRARPVPTVARRS